MVSVPPPTRLTRHFSFMNDTGSRFLE